MSCEWVVLRIGAKDVLHQIVAGMAGAFFQEQTDTGYRVVAFTATNGRDARHRRIFRIQDVREVQALEQQSA